MDNLLEFDRKEKARGRTLAAETKKKAGVDAIPFKKTEQCTLYSAHIFHKQCVKYLLFYMLVYASLA